MKKLTPQMLRRMVLEEKKKVEAAHAKENAKARKDYHLEETEEQWADADVPAAKQYKPGSKDRCSRRRRPAFAPAFVPSWSAVLLSSVASWRASNLSVQFVIH
jgi:hypothetical protein